jgi:NAD(P)-dependent dehydrogenase (short-subunit alcohol dehydrogenase family)
METQKIVFITGASREMGLGFETAKQLAEQGYHVILSARNQEAVEALAKKLKDQNLSASAFSIDITNDTNIAEVAQKIELQFGRIDVLINNAGAYFDSNGDVLNADLEYLKETLDTNLLGAWRVVKGMIGLLRKSSSARIVNVSSGAGSFSDPVFGLSNHPQNVPLYGISKLALNGFTVKLAKELKEEGILVNSVCPGWVATYSGTAEWGARPVSDGAKGIVWAATLPDDGPTGGFFRDGEVLGW